VAQAAGLTATVRPSPFPLHQNVTLSQVRLSSFDDACTDNTEFVGELPGACTYVPNPQYQNYFQY
jgi:hypothetical protein